MIDASLNGVLLSDACPEVVITKALRPLLPARRDEFVDVPGAAGALVYPEQPGDRLIRLHTVTLVDDKDELNTAVLRLADWADTTNGRVRLILDDEPDRYWSAILAVGPEVDDNGEFDAVSVLEYRCLPFARALTTTIEELTATGSPDGGTFVVVADVPELPVVEITPTNGTITALELATNDTSLSYTPASVIASGSTITISSVAPTVTLGANEDTELTGAYDPADVDVADVDGDFPVLLPGENAWQLTWSGTATEVEITYRWIRRYRR